MPDKKETAVKKPRQNQYEYSRRKGDGKWVKWELISDVDLGLMDLRVAKLCAYFPRRWVITDVANSKRELQR
jgi:hypothetical protein|tara:strand:- start:414 stop:629 length:216 start_codon:yes stop_codon:yes gene_type:complete